MRSLRALVPLAVLCVVGGSAAVAAGSVTGPDVSSFQHPYGQTITWSSVAAAGSSFAFIKATEGTGYVNPYYAHDAAQAHAAHLVVSAYHFARPALPVDTSATAQAQYFVSHAGGAAALDAVGELPPVLDLEVTGGLAPSDLLAWTQTWLRTVTQLSGRTPIIYTYPNFWPDAMANTTALGGYPLWIASYSTKPTIPAGWSTWTFWQYTDNATLPGMPSASDVSYFNGTLAQLQALANPLLAHNPFGFLDGVAQTPTGLSARGWAEDPDAASTGIPVHAYLDGTLAGHTAAASDERDDVAAAFPAGGADHGYTIPVGLPASAGAHRLCTYAINLGTGTGNPLLGCRTITVQRVPFGHLDTATTDGSTLTVAGWAIDPTTADPAPVAVSVDGQSVALTGAFHGSTPDGGGSWTAESGRSTAADDYRGDVYAVFPGFGAAHGYTLTVADPGPGSHRVCVSVLTPAGAPAPVGCTSVSGT